MGKYKDGTKSILISNIPKDEMKAACLEWANENEAMAEFLYTCYENGLETFGNHIAERYCYIEFILNNSHKPLKTLLEYMQNVDSARVIIMPDGGNPWSNEENFRRPNITISIDSAESKEKLEAMLQEMSRLINTNNNSKEKIRGDAFEPLVDIHDVFASKGSYAIIEAEYNNGQYRFSISGSKMNQRKLKYFKGLFEKAGLALEDNGQFRKWSIVSDSKEDFRERLIKVKEIIATNWTYQKATEIEEGMDFSEIARIKMEKMCTTLEGKSKFQIWLANEWTEEILRHACMRLVDRDEETARRLFTHCRDELEKFEYIFENYEDSVFEIEAKEKIKQYGTTPEGITQFKKWLTEQDIATVKMQEITSNAVHAGITNDQVHEAERVEHMQIINQQEMEGEIKNDY